MVKRRAINIEQVVYNTRNKLIDALLRIEMYLEWGGKCYVGDCFLASPHDMTIDHIIPQSNYLSDLEKIRKENSAIYRRDFQTHFEHLTDNPHHVENLAPACIRHNRKKGDKIDEVTTHVMRDGIQRAKKYGPIIAKRVVASYNALGIERDIVRTLLLPGNPNAKALLEKHVFGLVQMMEQISPGLASQTIIDLERARTFNLGYFGEVPESLVDEPNFQEVPRQVFAALQSVHAIHGVDGMITIKDCVEEVVEKCEQIALERIGSHGHDRPYPEPTGLHRVEVSGFTLYRDDTPTIITRLSVEITCVAHELLEETDNDGNPFERTVSSLSSFSATVSLNLLSLETRIRVKIKNYDEDWS
jgi:5-methylcytosine-specific restriction endonuclease McrA